MLVRKGLIRDALAVRLIVRLVIILLLLLLVLLLLLLLPLILIRLVCVSVCITLVEAAVLILLTWRVEGAVLHRRRRALHLTLVKGSRTMRIGRVR